MIGVFDSGVGGLTVLKEFFKKLPAYDYVYLGDNARSPYGNKTQTEIYHHTEQAVDFLFNVGCSLIVIACNTASAKALRKIQRNFLPKKFPGKKVLGVIIPTIEEISRKKYKTVGLIGTKSTVDSKKYSVELQKVNKKIKLYQQACPLLVPIVETGRIKDKKTKQIIADYLKPLKNKKIEALVLGCTHYSLLLDEIKDVAGKINIINPPAIVAEKLKDYLKRHKEIKVSKKKKRIFYTTGDPKKFKVLGERFLRRKINKIKKIKLQ